MYLYLSRVGAGLGSKDPWPARGRVLTRRSMGGPSDCRPTLGLGEGLGEIRIWKLGPGPAVAHDTPPILIAREGISQDKLLLSRSRYRSARLSFPLPAARSTTKMTGTSRQESVGRSRGISSLYTDWATRQVFSVGFTWERGLLSRWSDDTLVITGTEAQRLLAPELAAYRLSQAGNSSAPGPSKEDLPSPAIKDVGVGLTDTGKVFSWADEGGVRFTTIEYTDRSDKTG